MGRAALNATGKTKSTEFRQSKLTANRGDDTVVRLPSSRLVPHLTYSQMGIRKANGRSPIPVRYAGVYVKPSYSYLILVVYAK